MLYAREFILESMKILNKYLRVIDLYFIIGEVEYFLKLQNKISILNI